MLQESMKKTQPNKYQVGAEYFVLVFVHWLDKSCEMANCKVFFYDCSGEI